MSRETGAASRMAVDPTDPRLIVRVRVPLTPRASLMLAMMSGEHPEHVVTVEGDWLVLRHPEGG